MTVAGIIAEYNPFHNGHKYQIEQLRKQGITHIAAVMSGNFVQRGDAAVCSKWARAKMALVGGVDLVIELPVAYSLASAERFAMGGVGLLNALGLIDILAFGSESGNVKILEKTAKAVSSQRTNDAVKKHLQNGLTYPAALEQAVRETAGRDEAGILRNPNDTLGVAYIAALNKTISKILPRTVKRKGAAHDGEDIFIEKNGEYISSASYIRKLLFENADVSRFMPKPVYDILQEEIETGRAPACLETAERAVLSRLRALSAEQLGKIADTSEGIENRLFNAIQSAGTINEIYAEVKCKRYTLARIRRLVCCAVLSLTKEVVNIPPRYIRILGCGERGQEILRRAKKTTTLPIVMKYGDIAELGKEAVCVFEREVTAMGLYGLFTKKVCLPTEEMTTSAVIIK